MRRVVLAVGIEAVPKFPEGGGQECPRRRGRLRRSPRPDGASAHPIGLRSSRQGMEDDASRRDQLLAIGLTTHRGGADRRRHPDRRSGVDLRKARIAVPYNRDEGPTLLQKARSRLDSRLRQHSGTGDHPNDGLR